MATLTKIALYESMHAHFRIRWAVQNVVAAAATLKMESVTFVFELNNAHFGKPVMHPRPPGVPKIFTTASPKTCFVDNTLWQQHFIDDPRAWFLISKIHKKLRLINHCTLIFAYFERVRTLLWSQPCWQCSA